MWKKIHSNRDPRDTLYSEIHKEFGNYFSIAGNAFKRMTAAYPRLLLGCMMMLIAFSMILSFTVFRYPEEPRPVPVKPISPVAEGFNQIMQATGTIRETMKLKQLVDSLTAKSELSGKDSALLDSALDRLSRINKINRPGRP